MNFETAWAVPVWFFTCPIILVRAIPNDQGDSMCSGLIRFWCDVWSELFHMIRAIPYNQENSSVIMVIPYYNWSGNSSVFWAIPDDQGNSDDHEFQCDRDGSMWSGRFSVIGLFFTFRYLKVIFIQFLFCIFLHYNTNLYNYIKISNVSIFFTQKRHIFLHFVGEKIEIFILKFIFMACD